MYILYFYKKISSMGVIYADIELINAVDLGIA